MQQSDLVQALAEGLWAQSRKKMGLRADYMPASRTDFKAKAADEIERLRASTNDAPVERLVEAIENPAIAINRLNRDELGRLVRKAWVRWAEQQDNPKPSWLVPYDDLSEPDKEVDRQIGVDLARIGAAAWVADNRFDLRAALSSPSEEPAKIVGIDPLEGEGDEGPHEARLMSQRQPTPTDTADTPPASAPLVFYDSSDQARNIANLADALENGNGKVSVVGWRNLIADLNAALTTAPTTGVVDCPICHNNGSDCQVCVGGAMTIEQAAEWLRAQAIASMVENNREWFAQLAADNARQRLDETCRRNVRETA